VKTVHKAVAGAVVLGLAVGGCSVAAHLGALQPPALVRNAALTPLRPIAVRRPAIQLGAGIDLYTYRGQDFTTASRTEVAYLKALHANSVMVSFPFFMHGERARGVYTRPSTPTPRQLAVLAETAQRAGLYVSLRPLLDETSLGESRTEWKPRDPRAWFASYRRFLLPYARMAQRAKIAKLYVGAEFQLFGTSRRWNRLDRALRRVFKGTLAYAYNGHDLQRGAGGRGVRLSADSYPHMPGMPAGAGVRRLARAWTAYDRVMPRGTILSEVGIAGVRGAYARPWVHTWPHPRIDPAIQVRWFMAACRAVAAAHLGGIYFWAIGFGKDELTTRLSAHHEAAWEAGPGERAVAACFLRLRHG
jgi:hypothetical protein